MNNFVKVALIVFGIFSIVSCSKKAPEGAVAVKDFNPENYLGTWYEIARFDYRFEKNMDNVTANYSKNLDNSIKVTNKGYDYVKKEWKQSIGEARFQGAENVGSLKVTFFKPFWAGYHVIDLDENYQYALVSGSSTEYLWILSRTKTIPENIKTRFLNKAKSLNFPIEKLIWVKHNL